MMTQIMILTGILLLAPFIIGLLPMRFMRAEHRSLGMAYASGWLMMFALFQFMAIPFIVAERDFSEAERLYNLLLLTVLAVSVIFGIKTVRECAKNSFLTKNADKWTRLLWAAVFLLIAFQMAASVAMQYLDGDDALYVTTALQTQVDDEMYLKNPYYGYSQELDVRHALSPVPVFLAWIARTAGIHVTVLCHSIMGAVFLFLMYVLYGQIAKRLFMDKPKNVPLFLLYLNVWYLFGNVSLFTAETFAYTRTWQGKAMFGNLVVPAMFLWMFFAVRDEMKAGEWCMLFALSAVAAFTTSTGIFMFPIFMAFAGILLALYHKKLVILFEFAACCTPSIVYGILYLFLR